MLRFYIPGKEDEEKRIVVPAKSLKEIKENVETATNRGKKNLEELTVKALEFMPFSSNDLINQSVVNVIDPDFGSEVVRGMDDLRMGSLEKDKICVSCNQSNMDCPFHLGRIELPFNYLNPLYLKPIQKLLNIVCCVCGEVKFPKTLLDMYKSLPVRNRLKAVSTNLSKNPSCPRHSSKGKVGLEKYYLSLNGSYFKGSEIYEILKKIPKETLKFFGLISTPEDYVMKYFPILPICDRPYGYFESKKEGIKSDEPVIHPMSYFYQALILETQKISKISDPGVLYDKEKLIAELLYQIIIKQDDVVIDRFNIPRMFESIPRQLKGKEGYIRQIMMGKTVQFSGRTVLGPCSEVKFGEIGIPENFKMKISVPEKVNRYNKQRLLDLYYQGKIYNITFNEHNVKYAGIRRNVDPYLIQNYTPQLGDTLERQLQDGDFILFNRQPTIHKYSMMGYRVKFYSSISQEVGYKSRQNFGLHISYTTPHNADYDGDEGNIHFLQSIDARIEAATIVGVDNCILSGQGGKPTMGFVFNEITTGYLISRKRIELSKEVFTKGYQRITHPYRSLEEITDYTAVMLFCCVLPRDFNYSKKNKSGGTTKIENGILVSGEIDKDIIGPVGGSIAHSLYKNYGKSTSARFFTDGIFVLDFIITELGFSVGYRDLFIEKRYDDQSKETIKSEIGKLQFEIFDMFKEYFSMRKVDQENTEREAARKINSTLGSIKKEVKGFISKDNNIDIMVSCGARGSLDNEVNTLTLIGQQFFYGQLFPRLITNNTRCVPYYRVNDTRILNSRGFINNSYVDGMTAVEETFHLASTRVGMINTAISTGETGYLFKKLVKVFEDTKMCYEGSIRNSRNDIFQFAYLDGFDPSMIRKVNGIQTFINIKECVDRINKNHGF